MGVLWEGHGVRASLQGKIRHTRKDLEMEGSYMRTPNRHVTEGCGNGAFIYYRVSVRGTKRHSALDQNVYCTRTCTWYTLSSPMHKLQGSWLTFVDNNLRKHLHALNFVIISDVGVGRIWIAFPCIMSNATATLRCFLLGSGKLDPAVIKKIHPRSILAY
jgi:hypothetical protein